MYRTCIDVKVDTMQTGETLQQIYASEQSSQRASKQKIIAG